MQVRPTPPYLTLGLGLVCCSALACAGLGPKPKVPSVETFGYSQSPARRSHERPLIVEWSSSDRASLEGRMNEGLVVTRYEDGELEVLHNCRVDGQYKFQRITRKKEREVIDDASELRAKVRVGAARLEPILAAKGSLTLDTTIIGNYRSDRGGQYSQDQLEGKACRNATHVVESAQVGAFILAGGAAHTAQAQGDAWIVGAEMSHSSVRDVVREDGVIAACDETQGQADAPPRHCGAIIRLELEPLRTDVSEYSASSPGRLIIAGSSVLVSGLLVGGGILAGGLASGSSAQRKIEAMLNDERPDLIEKGHRANAMAYSGAAIVGGSLLVGSILLMTGRRQQNRLRVAPWSSGRATGMTMEVSF